MITPEQRELRKKYLGSSDLPPILGLDPWRTQADVWLEKTGRLDREAKETEVQDFGQFFEGPVLDYFATKHRVTLERNLFLTNDIFCSNLDGLIDGSSPEVVEAKTTGKDEDWGPTGTDEIPERVLIQVHEQMYVVSHASGKDCRVAWIPVLLPGFRHLEVRVYRIQRNDMLMDNAIKIGDLFWRQHVLTDERPEVFKPSMEMLKRARREPNKTVTIEDKIVLNWADAIAIESSAKKLVEEAKTAVLAAMGDAEAGRWSRGLVTYLEQSNKGYTVAPFSYRVLRRQKGGAI